MVTPLYPYLPPLHRAFLLARQDIVPRPIRSARISKKVTQIRGMAPLPCSGGICSSFVPQDQIAACPPRWSEKGFPRSSCSFEPFVTFVVKTGDSSCRLVLSRGIRSSFVPRNEYRMTSEFCIVRRTKILFLSGKNTWPVHQFMQEAVFCMLVCDLDSACLDGWAMHKARAMGVIRWQVLLIIADETV